MKSLYTWLFFGVQILSVGLGTLTAAENIAKYVNVPPEQISIGIGETRSLEVPFPVEKLKINSSCITARLKGIRTLEISGKKIGRAVARVGMQGLEKEYRVTVFNALMPVYREIVGDLAEFPEITAEIRENAIILRGEVTDPERWLRFQNLHNTYKSQCLSYVIFRPGLKLFNRLKQELNQAGFKCQEQISPDAPNELKLTFDGQTLDLSGYFYCQAEIERLKAILDRHNWLKSEWNGNNLRMTTDFRIADIQFDVRVVFVGITRSQLKRLGNSSADGTVLNWDLIAWFRSFGGDLLTNDSQKSGKGNSMFLNTTLKGSLQFFGENGISDFRDGGQVTLTNNSKTPAIFENGGTLNVKLIGSESVDMKEIDYGLKLQIQGGLVRPGLMSLDLNLEKSLAPVQTGDDYLQRKTKSRSQILCPLGKTAIIAGQQENSIIKNGPAGYAFLRHVPIVNWILSHRDDNQSDLRLFILVYPQIINKHPELTKPQFDAQATDLEVQKNIEKSAKDIRKSENANWFKKMFIW